jgi:hypothetical protein
MPEHVRLDGPDRLADAGHLVGSQVVHDHDVTEAEHVHQLLLDPGAEDVSGHGAVDHQGGDQAV